MTSHSRVLRPCVFAMNPGFPEDLGVVVGVGEGGGSNRCRVFVCCLSVLLVYFEVKVCLNHHTFPFLLLVIHQFSGHIFRLLPKNCIPASRTKTFSVIYFTCRQ